MLLSSFDSENTTRCQSTEFFFLTIKCIHRLSPLASLSRRCIWLLWVCHSLQLLCNAHAGGIATELPIHANKVEPQFTFSLQFLLRVQVNFHEDGSVKDAQDPLEHSDTFLWQRIFTHPIICRYEAASRLAASAPRDAKSSGKDQLVHATIATLKPIFDTMSLLTAGRLCADGGVHG